MNPERVADYWKRLKDYYADVVARRAHKKRLAEWLAREHKTDPIHK